MSERISDERIAQLLDGNVSAEERAELLSRLAADGNDFAVFAETGGVLRELEEAESGTEPPPLAETPPAAAAAPAAALPADRQAPPSTRQRPRWGGRRARWLALVPVLALALLVPVLWSRGGAGGPGAPAAALAAGTRLPEDRLQGNRPWPTTRGGSDPTVRPDLRASAARIGVFHTDLELAVAARDSAATVALVRKINHLLRQVIFADTTRYAEIADSAGASPEVLQPLLKEAGEQVIEDMDMKADLVRLGAWGEGALIAAEQRDTAFFRAPEMRRAFRRAAGDDTLPPKASEAARGIRNADPDAFDDLKLYAGALLRAIGTERHPE